MTGREVDAFRLTFAADPVLRPRSEQKVLANFFPLRRLSHLFLPGMDSNHGNQLQNHMKATKLIGVVAFLLLAAGPAGAQTFIGTDLGGPGLAGSAVNNGGGQLTIVGGGADIWGNSDQCFYYWAWASGQQWAAVVEITDLQGPDNWTKAELMVRWSDPNAGPQANDAFIAAMSTRSGGQNEIADQFRSSRGGSADSVARSPVWRPTYPTQWMRLTRTNSVFGVWFGSDGVHWTNYLDIDTASSATVGSSTFGTAWPDAVTVGLAVTAHNDTDTGGGIAQFSNLNVTFPPVQPPTVIGATTQVHNATNYQGSEVTFTFVTTNNAQPNVVTWPTFVAYQWYRNAAAIPGATSTSYTHLINPYDSTENGAQINCQATIKPPYNGTVSGLQSAVGTERVLPGALMYTNGLKLEFFPNALRQDVEFGNVGAASYLSWVPGLDLNNDNLPDYTRRLSGWFRPDTTTNYVFFVAADDDMDLLLSTDANPANKRLIAQELGYSGFENYTNAGGPAGGEIQKRSDTWTNSVGATPYASGIPLIAGNLYYLEAVHHEGVVGDNLSVTYAFTDGVHPAVGPTNGTPALLTGSKLVLITSPATWLLWSLTPTNITIAMGLSGAFYATATSDNELRPLYQWYKNGTPVAGGTSTSLATGIVSPADNGNTYYVVAKTAEGGLSITSSVATLSVTSPVFERGWANIEFWQGQTSAAVEAGAAGIPTYTTTSPGFEAGLNGESGDKYARRISGYFMAPATDEYVFYVCSDNESDLFLSTDSTMANKRLIAQQLGWADGVLQWGSGNVWINQTISDPWVRAQTRSDQWTNGVGNTPYANGIHLIGGQKYYIEGVQHDSGGGDYFSATYKRLHTSTGMPDPDPISGQDTRLRGSVLGMNATRCFYVAYTQQPANVTVAPSASGTFTFTVAGRTDSQTPVGITGDPRPLVSSPGYLIYQWQKNGSDIPGATSSSFSYKGTILPSDNGAQFTCRIRALGYVDNSLNLIWSNSQPAVLTVTPPVTLVNEYGLIKVEHWDGKVVSDVVSGAAGSPAWVSTSPAFEVSINNESGDTYARRLSGFFIPPTTEDYVFWINSDDDSVLYLSAEASPLSKHMIAQQTVYSGPFTWLGGNGLTALKRSDQFSDWTTGLTYPNGFHLSGGQKYYMEAIQHEGTGGDHVEVTYSMLGSTPNNNDDTLMMGSQIGFPAPASHVAFTKQPQSANATNLSPVTFTVGASTDSVISFGSAGDIRNFLANYLRYQWYKSGTAIAGASTSKLIIAEPQPADNGAQIVCAVRSIGLGDAAGNPIWSNSQPATLTVISVAPTLLYSAIWTDYNPTNLGSSAVTYVDLTFSKHMDINALLNPTNYTLGTGLSIVAIVVNSNDYRHVELAVSGIMILPFNVTVRNMTDASGLPLSGSAMLAVQPVRSLVFADIGTPGSDPLYPSSLWVDSSNAFTIVAEGSDIWGNSDGCNFMYEIKTNDFDVVVRQKSTTHVCNWTKGGVMVRETLDSGSRNWNVVNDPLSSDGIMAVDGSGYGADVVECNARVSTAGASASFACYSPAPAPAYPNAWVRLKRTGQLLSAFSSTNGVTWTLLATNTPALVGDLTPLPAAVYVGICTTAHGNNTGFLNPDPYWDTAVYADYNSSYVAIPPAARLSYSVSGTGGSKSIQISWTPAGGHLESSTALGGNADWQPVTPASNPVTLPITGTARFFRAVNP